MTPNEIRDEMARMDGYRDACGGGALWTDASVNSSRLFPHPYPNTLDAAAAALPEGWWWTKEAEDGEKIRWYAFNPRYSFVSVPDTGNEIDDRHRLAYEAKVAMKGAQS